ncbi:MAG TPA: L,D-transpeptidase [Pyrinomonadaceae bacterium]|nr:L,D-transpeptidase [Pyrinomonadaceae bacterium]
MRPRGAARAHDASEAHGASCARALLEAPRADGASRVQVLVPERAAEEPRHPPLTPDEEALNRRPLKLPLGNPRILVRKGERRLELFEGGERVRVFRAGLGFAPEGDKERQGDGRTPEGEFYVCMKNGRSSFHVSLGLNYPDADAAERALRDGLITRAQHERIVRANREGRCPPWNTRLGGEIFIHGGGTGSDWTFGCVALENEHVEELFKHVPTGTPVRIEP